MPTVQLSLFPDEPQQHDQVKTKRDPIWYYVHDLVFDMMLIVEDDGEWGWVAHDTVNNTPHLFNTRKLAQQQAGRLGHGKVKSYPWKR